MLAATFSYVVTAASKGEQHSTLIEAQKLWFDQNLSTLKSQISAGNASYGHAKLQKMSITGCNDHKHIIGISVITALTVDT